MSQKIEPQKRAAAHFLTGYNCAQSVLLTMFEHWNCRNEIVPKIATAFGGGIGRSGSMCGALTGGVMALGVKYGTNEPSLNGRLKAYELAHKFYKQFEEKHGGVLCRDLIGFDLSDQNEFEKARASRVFEVKCVKFVEGAVEILLRLCEH